MTCSICNYGCSRVLVPIDTFLHRNIKIRRFASHNLRLRSMRVLRLKTFGLPFSICMTFFFCLRLRGCGALMTCLLSLSVNELEDCEVRLSLLSDTVKSLFGLVVIWLLLGPVFIAVVLPCAAPPEWRLVLTLPTLWLRRLSRASALNLRCSTGEKYTWSSTCITLCIRRTRNCWQWMRFIYSDIVHATWRWGRSGGRERGRPKARHLPCVSRAGSQANWVVHVWVHSKDLLDRRPLSSACPHCQSSSYSCHHRWVSNRKMIH